MQIEKIPASKIKPATYNPRKDLKPADKEYQHIKNSIEQFGYIDPIIWNERTGNLVGGHQRFKILQAQGMEEIECVVVDFDEATEKAANMAVNKAQGDWDLEKLDSLLKEVSTEFQMEKFGFDAYTEQQDIMEDDFEPKLPKNPKAKPGEIYMLGVHRLMCGDSTSAADVKLLMGGAKADLIVTDPPYNVNYKGGTQDHLKIQNDNMGDAQFLEFLTAAFTRMHEHARTGCAIYVFHSDTGGYAFRKAFTDSGFSLKQCLIWVKNSFVLGRQDYQWRHEPCLYGWKDGAAHYFIDDRKQCTIFEDKVDINKLSKAEMKELLKEYLEAGPPSTVICEDRPARSPDHPTMKPVKLIGRLIKNSSKEKELVADFFCGSGTTLIACEQLGRICYGMEYDPKYVDVIIERWEKFTGERAIKLIE